MMSGTLGPWIKHKAEKGSITLKNLACLFQKEGLFLHLARSAENLAMSLTCFINLLSLIPPCYLFWSLCVTMGGGEGFKEGIVCLA